MHFLPNKLALACAIALARCLQRQQLQRTGGSAATKASLMQTMDEALREGQALDPYGFAIDAASIAKRKALDSSLLKRLDALDSSVLSERDRLFYDMIRWDLQINLAGYDLPQSQIPIHHFRNRVVDLADGGGRPGQWQGSPHRRARLRLFRAELGRAGRAGDAAWRRDIDRPAAAPVPASKARAATAPQAWYQEHLTWLKAYDGYLAEVKHQFELGSAQGNTLPDELVDRLLAQLNSKLDGR